MRNSSPPPRGWIAASLLTSFAAEATDAHRLATLSDGWVERLGSDVLISYQTESALAELRAGLEAWCAAIGWTAERVFGKFIPRQNAERISPALLTGAPTGPMTTVVHEVGIRYGLDFAAGYSAGLFIDQRANRQRLRAKAPKRVLNTFAYTCSFSVVAALAGARTTSLDLSRKSLNRGEENFRLNGLESAGHSFIADDVLEVLPRLARRGEKYDAIILDPPTFSRGEKGRRFQVEKDLEGLLAQALELAAPKAEILISTNCARLEHRELERMTRYCLKLSRRNGRLSVEPDLPDFPDGAGARTVWLTV